MTVTPFRWAVECVRDVERLTGTVWKDSDDPLETYYKRATRAAVMVLEEGLPLTLAFMASRGSKDPGTLLAYHLAMYLNHVVFADEPEWSELREECFGRFDDVDEDEIAEKVGEYVRDEVREALVELAGKEGTLEMRYAESRALELLNVIKRVAEGWHKVSRFGGGD
ncbi:type III-B CRISPR module-associated protein Cmr5 [Methanopyrus kandleri]|uniref:type III-B CRISPR module-associated protein Cmr5 n=1 Tax=Methanopyrus kandleri TaxID=2320 RepID=UPI00042DAC45|nr:type III-B CRISPR module-associated protein Cmr5 [Methanopyrus kandleri]